MRYVLLLAPLLLAAGWPAVNSDIPAGRTAIGVAGLIVLHGMDGQTIYVNPDQVTNLRKPRSTDQGHFAKGINCLVFQADGKYFATLESCEDVRKRLQE